ncbi:MAG: DUF4091 domain-containing protein [Sandaracinus sp.]
MTRRDDDADACPHDVLGTCDLDRPIAWRRMRGAAQALVASAMALAVWLAPGALARAQSHLARVWAVDDGEKVRREDLSHWAATSPDNAVWDGTTVRVFAAQNETVAFQLILESDGVGAREVNVTLAELRHGSDVIANEGPYDPGSFVGRRIELFTEHYLHVTERSAWSGSWGWWGARPLPDEEHIGWIPDALIPFEAPAGEHAHGVGGAPFAIAPSSNQGVWVDLFVPRGTAPGTYTGTAILTEEGTESLRVPVELEVFPFALPDETHQRNMFVFGPVVERHGLERDSPEYWAMVHRYMNLAHRHRMDLTDGARSLDDMATSLAGYYTGAFYTREHGYEGPGEGVGNGTYSIGTYDQPDGGWRSGFAPNDRETWQRAADAWEQWFRDHAPGVFRFKYMDDEPRPEAYAGIRERAEWIHTSPGPGQDLLTFDTVRIDPALYGAIDVWALTVQSGYEEDGVTAGYDLPKVAERRALGERAAIYNGTRPSYGQASALDAFATENRVNPWICWKYDVDLYFLWETSVYTEYGQNAWVDQYTYGEPGERPWGDGNYLYAGEDALFPDDSRGYAGPIASVRMKNWRRGQQDYEYLWLAREAGIAVDDLVDEVVPAAFDDYASPGFDDQGDQPLWATRGFRFERARRRLAERLAAALGTCGDGACGVGESCTTCEADCTCAPTTEGDAGTTTDAGLFGGGDAGSVRVDAGRSGSSPVIGGCACRAGAPGSRSTALLASIALGIALGARARRRAQRAS